MKKKVAIEGFVADGFEAVAEAFQHNFTRDDELGAAFAVVKDGEPVVDIWGGLAIRETQAPWTRDTLQLIFSGSKGLLATMMLMLIDRNLIALDAPVSRYWPEFGKDDIRIRHIVSHTARLPGNSEPLAIVDLIDARGMAARLARQAPSRDPRAALCYHPLNFGWLSGEVIRRVSGLTAGQFLAQEIARPLSLDLWIGLPEAEDARASTLYLASNWGIAPFFSPTLWAHDPLVDSIWGNPPLWGDPVNWRPDSFPWNGRAFRAAEVPGANAIGTARSLAALYGVLATGGGALLSPDALAFGRRAVADGLDEVHGNRLRTGVGYQLQTELRALGPPEDAFGHTGAGGSCHGAWPELGVGFSYVMNLMQDPTSGDQRAPRLLTALHEALASRSRRRTRGTSAPR
jgi:CubicO group peptidase (beta-lactamase class C family)